MDLSLEEICLKKMKGEQGENNVKSNYQIEGNRLCHFLHKRHIYLPKYECIILEIDIQILARLFKFTVLSKTNMDAFKKPWRHSFIVTEIVFKR